MRVERVLNSRLSTLDSQLSTLDSQLSTHALRQSRDGTEPYDGVAELWRDSLEDLAAAISSPEAQRAARELLKDEHRFIDPARSAIWLAEEHPIIGG